jgi:hypothetical protein
VHGSLDHVAALEQAGLPSGGVEAVAKHHGVTFATVDVLHDAFPEERGGGWIASQDGLW